MIKLFKEIVRYWSLRRRNVLSIYHGISKLLTVQQLRTLLSQCMDHRDLVREMGKLLKISERDALIAVSRQIRVPYQDVVRAIELDDFNTGQFGADITISTFRKIGAIPVLNGGYVSGIVCTDPASVYREFNIREEILIWLSTWGKISKALDESERNLIEKLEKADLDKRKQSRVLALKAIGFVLIEAEKNKKQKAQISFQESSISYSFDTKDNRTARGEIRPVVREPLLEIFSDNADKKGMLVALPHTEHERIVHIKRSQTVNIYELRWSKKRQSLHLSSELESQIKKVERVTTDGIVSLDEHRNKKEDPPLLLGDMEQILIVDDNVTFAKVLERFFSRQRYNCVHAVNGEEALKILREKSVIPAAIVCDLHMPIMNGLQFLKEVKKDLSFTNLPFIMLTSDDDIEAEVKGISEGVDAFVLKTEDPRILILQLQRLIAKAHSRRAA